MKFNNELSVDLKQHYIITRFSVEEDAWPPEQPKEYTTLALIHHKNQPTHKQVLALSKAKGAGKVENILAATGDQLLPSPSGGINEMESLSECLHESKCTRNIADILAPLEDPNENQLKTLLIEGAPGLGKTILLKQIAFEWAQQKQLVKSKLLFLLLLRDPAVLAISSVSDLVSYFYNRSAENQKVFTNIISNENGRNITFLLDGYDELPPSERQDSFIAKIINHKILPLSVVVVSSRPHASTSLRSNALCQVDILGFTKEDQLLFFQNALKDHPIKLKELLQYLDTHPTINSLCYIPFIMTVLLWLFKQGVHLPNSSAELYNSFICHTIRHQLVKYKVFIDSFADFNTLPQPYKMIIQQLSVLCLKALETNDLVFSLQDIKSVCPKIDTFPGAINAFGLLQAVEHYSQDPKMMGTPTKTLNFIHFSIQEYLAAYQITCLPPKKELQFIKMNFFSEFYSNTFALYVGMTKGQRPCFKKFMSCYGKNFISSFFTTNTNKIASKFIENHRKALRLFQCFHEADDQVSCTNITKNINNGIDLYYSDKPLLPSDITCLATFLTYSSKEHWSYLLLNSCYIGDAGLKMVNQSLVTNGVTIAGIVLTDCLLSSQSEEVLVEIVSTCKIQRLYLGNNNFTDGLDLSNNSALNILTMSNNNMSSRGASRLFSTLRSNKHTKLMGLSISNNNIGDEAVNDIAQFLIENNVLEYLYIYNNKFTDQGIIKILRSLHSNRTLYSLHISEHFKNDKILAEKNKIRQDISINFGWD